MWYGRESGCYITGFEPVQRVGVYLDREEEDKKRNFQQKGLRKPKGYGAPFYASPAAQVVGGVVGHGQKRLGERLIGTLNGVGKHWGDMRWKSRTMYERALQVNGPTEYCGLVTGIGENACERDRRAQDVAFIKRETALLHKRFIGVTFAKSVGHLGMFIGVVKEVWRHDRGNHFASVYM